ncbi:MAG: response regulator [Spirochaetes bacterium]|jgi:DNA-binding response OmpR family regulator|nr:response regulator [Spirochaetota bacterium]
MKKILIVDPTDYANELISMIKETEIDYCTTAFDAISNLNMKAYDLVIAEVDLPGDNSFEFYYYLNKNLPYMPVIMTTNRDIDDYFDEIFKNGIGNVLYKPIDKGELLGLISKLLRESPIFGLKNYLSDIIEHKKIRISSSTQINAAINKITTIVQQWNFEIENLMMMNLILNELIINAVYHAHGFTKEKLERKKITLPNNKYVDIFFAHNGNEYAICIRDYMGTLSSKRILESINAVITQRKTMERALESGVLENFDLAESGRGIELVRKLVKEYYFIIQKNKRTETILKFDSIHTFESNPVTSLKIIERE